MKSLFEHFSNATRNMQNVYIVVCLFAILLLRITFARYTSESDPTLVEYMAGNILPELTGMIIELVVIFFIVDAIQGKEQKRKEEADKLEGIRKQVMLERRLRAQLRFLFRRIFDDIKLPSGITGNSFLFHAADHLMNKEIINEFKIVLANELHSDTFKENLIDVCLTELPLILSLSPVCSELSDRHVKAWMSIAHYLQQINTGNNISHNIERVFAWIAIFDKQTFGQGLVGNK